MNHDSVVRIYQDILQLGLPVLLFAGVSTLIVVVLLLAAGSRVSRDQALFPLSFAVLGGTSGAIAGSSFEPLVGAMVTGVLALVSGLVSYAFTKTKDRLLRASIPPTIILLLINVLTGLSVGRAWKVKWDVYATNLDRYRAKRDGIWVPVTREYQMLIVRKCVGDAKSEDEARRLCNYSTLFPGS